MRAFIVATALILALPAYSVLAQTSPPAKTAVSHYTTSDTDIGTLLDDPAARSIVDKYIPDFSSGPQVDMARSMTLKAIQPFASDKITDQVLSNIDADLAKLPPKK
jgi:hypothetical protein